MNQMLYLETNSQDPAYNLAYEEYILQNFRQGNILILWQNDNAVIVGRNQNTAEEIDQAFIDAHGIRVIRRNTGGGAVYHDLGNLNYSFIADAGSVDQAASRFFLEPVVQALRALGLDAQCSGRNDILVSGKKVSGTAQQFSKGRLLLHGTLLFDSDPSMIGGALNPDPEKYRSKGIKSVRSRVGSIRQALKQDMELPAFWSYLKQRLTAGNPGHIHLSDVDLENIRHLKSEKYDTWEWNYGKSPKFEIRNKHRWSGGLLDIRLSIVSARIDQIRIYGDFLSVEPVTPLEQCLTGCTYRAEALYEALESFPLRSHLGTITRDELVRTILNDLP